MWGFATSTGTGGGIGDIHSPTESISFISKGQRENGAGGFYSYDEEGGAAAESWRWLQEGPIAVILARVLRFEEFVHPANRRTQNLLLSSLW